MSAPVITLFEAYGSGALVLGPLLAEKLGVPWIGQQVSSQQLEAADPKGTGRVDVRGFLQSLAFVDVGSIELLESPYVAMARKQAIAVQDLVKEGGVILGRNATVILNERPNALHVKLEGPVDERIARAAEREGITKEQAALRMVREDNARAEMSLDVWGWDPRKTAFFDMVLNVDSFGPDAVVEMILDGLKRKNAKAGLVS